MADEPKVVTGLGLAELHRVLVRGKDLTEELVGNITFTDMVLFELAGRMPTPNQRRMIDALLVILVEHGMIASVVAARSTYHTAPEAIQGAVATAILSAGSVHLGSSEYCARMLIEAWPAGRRGRRRGPHRRRSRRAVRSLRDAHRRHRTSHPMPRATPALSASFRSPGKRRSSGVIAAFCYESPSLPE